MGSSFSRNAMLLEETLLLESVACAWHNEAWLERSPPTNVAWVHIPVPSVKLCWTCRWFSSLFPGFSAGFPVFLPPQWRILLKLEEERPLLGCVTTNSHLVDKMRLTFLSWQRNRPEIASHPCWITTSFSGSFPWLGTPSQGKDPGNEVGLITA